MATDNHWALVLAAGDGRRLQGLTRTATGAVVPKQFCSLDGGLSFLEETVQRAESIVPSSRICAVVAAAHRAHWSRHLESLPPENIVAQPRNRGTAIGVLLPLLHILRRDPSARIVLLPSDHHINNEERLAASLRAALGSDGSRRDNIVLLGIEPGEPDPELGYIVPKQDAHTKFRGVERFVEKPSRAEAQELIRRGALWNAFIIAADGRALLRLFEESCPDVVARMRRLVDFEPRVDCPSGALAELYDELPELDFSRGVLQGKEKHLQVLAVPACGWSDLGTPERVAQALRGLRSSSPGARCNARSRAPVNLSAQHELLHASMTNSAFAHAI